MAKTRDRMTDAVDTARPYVERIAKDEDLHDHVKSAYESARRVYDELIGDRGATGLAMRVARDRDLQDEVRHALDELREARNRLQKAEESHTGRNVFLLLAGIAIGVLFNPVTGPTSRGWMKDRLFGAEEPYEYQSNQQG